jgi:hypothetical protein
MEGNVGVGASRSVRLGWTPTMALRWPEGNQRGRLFPRKCRAFCWGYPLLGLSAKFNLDEDGLENQFLSSDLISLPNSSNAPALVK